MNSRPSVPDPEKDQRDEKTGYQEESLEEEKTETQLEEDKVRSPEGRGWWSEIRTRGRRSESYPGLSSVRKMWTSASPWTTGTKSRLTEEPPRVLQRPCLRTSETHHRYVSGSHTPELLLHSHTSH